MTAIVAVLGGIVVGSATAQALPVVESHAMLSSAAPVNFAAAMGATPVQPLLESSSRAASNVDADLPDAPSADMQARNAPPLAGKIAPRYASTIPEYEVGQSLTARDKVVIGFKDSISPINFAGMALSAGYSHVTNGQPNYGRNATAFGKRFGAAAVRETSETLFTEAVFAPLLHQDPRYYVRGKPHGFVNRTLYSITRPLITRTDSGRSTVNASLLAGYAASTALNNAYYPQINRNFKDNASGFGGSIGGAALGFFVTEFTDDVKQFFHIKTM